MTQPVPGPSPDSVAVLIDYENVARTAARAFLNFGEYLGYGHIRPWDLAALIVEKRKRPSYLSQVHVFRGRPNPWKQAESARAHDRQRDSWEDGVQLHSRNLFYPDEWPNHAAMEKGVDVELAVTAIELAMTNAVKTVVVVSHDNDLIPAIETIIGKTKCHVEVAAWAGCNRLTIDKERRTPWCHFLSDKDFESVRDQTDYTSNPSRCERS